MTTQREQTEGRGNRLHERQGTGAVGCTPSRSGEGAFLRGVVTGVGVSAVTMFIGLGLWFRSEEGAPYRKMLGEPTRLSLDTQTASEPPLSAPKLRAASPYAPALAGVADDGDQRAGATSTAVPSRPPRWPAALSAIEAAYDELAQGAVDEGPAGQGQREATESGAAEVKSLPEPDSFVFDSNASDDAMGPSLGRGVAQPAPASTPGQGPNERTRSDRDAYREIGLDELVQQNEHNREVIGRAAALLRSFAGK